jgi:hypothetical protein
MFFVFRFSLPSPRPVATRFEAGNPLTAPIRPFLPRPNPIALPGLSLSLHRRGPEACRKCLANQVSKSRPRPLFPGHVMPAPGRPRPSRSCRAWVPILGGCPQRPGWPMADQFGSLGHRSSAISKPNTTTMNADRHTNPKRERGFGPGQANPARQGRAPSRARRVRAPRASIARAPYVLARSASEGPGRPPRRRFGPGWGSRLFGAFYSFVTRFSVGPRRPGGRETSSNAAQGVFGEQSQNNAHIFSSLDRNRATVPGHP